MLNVADPAAPATEAINDNDMPPAVTISFTDLAAQSGIDEDTLLRRLADVLDRRAKNVKEVTDAKS